LTHQLPAWEHSLPRLRPSAKGQRGLRDTYHGALAQLGERLICIQEVIGSIPIGSTSVCCGAGEGMDDRRRMSFVLRSFGNGNDIVEREKHQYRLVLPSRAGPGLRAEGDIVPSLVRNRCGLPGRRWVVRTLPSGRDSTGSRTSALLFPDRIKREKGVWWMPRQQEAMKDVVPCVKPWGAGNRL
jgi:hypothetical protein